MYITVLDYLEAKVHVHEVSNDIDAEDYVSETFGLSNVEWIVTLDLNLECLTIKSD